MQSVQPGREREEELRLYLEWKNAKTRRRQEAALLGLWQACWQATKAVVKRLAEWLGSKRMLVDVADLEIVEEPAAPAFLYRHPYLLSELAASLLRPPLRAYPSSTSGVVHAEVAVRAPRVALRFWGLTALGGREEKAGEDEQRQRPRILYEQQDRVGEDEEEGDIGHLSVILQHDIYAEGRGGSLKASDEGELKDHHRQPHEAEGHGEVD